MKWAFEPLADITAYELAVCVANFVTVVRPPKDGVEFGNIEPPELVRRHFRAQAANELAS